MLSEQQLQLLALAEEVESLQAELDKQRSKNLQLQAQMQNGAQHAAAPPSAVDGGAGPSADSSGIAAERGPGPALVQPPKKGRRRGYSFWQWVAGTDVMDAELGEA